MNTDLWTELPARPGYPEAFAGPWRAWSFERDLRLGESVSWTPPNKVSTAGIKEEGIETLVFMNLATLFPDWYLRAGPKDPFDWGGADIVASDPIGSVHLFEVKYGASEANVVDQALSYAVELLRERRLRWFDQQPEALREVLLASRIAAFWSNDRSDKWERPRDRSRGEGLRRALENKVAAFAARTGESPPALLEEWLAEARMCAKAMEPSATHIGIDAQSSGDATGLHLHLVVPSWTSIAAGQLEALSRLKFRGLQVSLWQVACEKRGDRAGVFAIREIWLRPINTQKGTKDSESPPSAAVRPLLSQAAIAAGVRPSRAWRLSRRVARIGAEWHGDTIPEFGVERQGSRVCVRVKTVAPEGWQGFEAGAKASAARKQIVTRWLQEAVPPADAAMAAALETQRPRTLTWQTNDPETGLALTITRFAGLVWADVTWEHDATKSGQLLTRLVRTLDEVSLRHPSAFSAEL